MHGIKMYKQTHEFDLTDVQLSGEGKSQLLRIPTLREGNYTHPFFGVIKHNVAFMNKIIKNFKENVLGTDLPVDAGHNPDGNGGAFGWVKDLRIEELEDGRKGLIVYAEPTDLGLDAVKGKRFKYASISYNPEFYDSEDLDRETSHGPVMYGVALTNVPFIKKQKTVEVTMLSDETDNNEFIFSHIKNEERIMENEKTPETEEVKTEVSSDPTPPVTPELDLTVEEPEVELEVTPAPTDVTLSVEEYKEQQDTIKKLAAQVGALEVELKSAEISGAVETAMSRGVDKATTEYISTVMRALRRDDKGIVKMSGRSMNAYQALKVFLSDVVPGNVPVHFTEQTANRTVSPDKQDEEEIDLEDVKSFTKLAN